MVTQAFKLLVRSGAVYWIAASAAVWGAYQVVRPTRPDLAPAQTSLARELEHKAAEWAMGLEIPRQSAVLVTFARDRFGAVSDRVRTAIWRSDRLDLRDYRVGEKFVRAIEWTRRPADSLAEAVERGRRQGAALVVWGRVNEFSAVGGEARLAAEVVIAEAATGALVASEAFDLREAGSGFVSRASNARGRGAGWSLVSRLFVWIAASLLLPLVTFPVARRVLESESNANTFFLLMGYVLVSVVVAYGLLFSAAQGVAAAFALLAMTGLAILYYWRALAAIKRATVESVT